MIVAAGGAISSERGKVEEDAEDSGEEGGEEDKKTDHEVDAKVLIGSVG